MLRTAANPDGLPRGAFDDLRRQITFDRSKFYKNFAIPFFSADRPGAEVPLSLLDEFWLMSMQAGLKNAYAGIKAFSETDFTDDLRKFDMPTLVVHGEDDQIVPIAASGHKAARIIKHARAIFYPGAPHGLIATKHAGRFNADLLDFLLG
jgi:non-heme chloroperoxidase